jgi:type I restriction enzyme, S subunit
MNQDRTSTTTNSQLKDGYKQTEVGVIPENWEIKRLKHISPSQSVGLVINPSSYFDNAGSVPMLVGSHVNENGIDWESANRISDFSNNLLPSSRLAAGDLVTVRVGDPGLTAVVPSELDGCNCASMMIVRQHRSFVSRWLCYVMNSPFGRSQIDHVQYGTAQKQFNISDAVDFSYPVPPLAEQEAIAHTLSDIDALIESLDRFLTKKRQIKQGAMQELLTGKRRLLGFDEAKGYKQTEIGMIPTDWEIQTLGEIATFTNGKAHESEIKESGRYIVVNSKFISTEAEVKKYSDKCFCATSKEDILIVMSDVPNGKAIAKCFLVDKDNTYTVNQRICSLKTIMANSKFIIYQLNRNPFYLRFDDGVKQTNLRRDEVLSCPLAIPLLEEQIEIANILSDMDAEIGSIESKLIKTRQLKQGMMHELLTGRIRLVDKLK